MPNGHSRAPLADGVYPMPDSNARAVALCSGGLDSATAMALAREEGYALYALSFDYGQRHRCELDAAATVAKALGAAAHRTVTIDLRAWGGSALTADLAVPHDRTPDEMEAAIPVTYVPARNTIFLAYALAWAEVLEAEAIVIGVNAVDYSGYPDCRPEYIRACQGVADLATRRAVEGNPPRILAPLIAMTKAAIIRAGTALGVDYSLTHSCYDPDAAGRACGRCDACQIRRQGFAEAGLPDPTRYTPNTATPPTG